MNDNNTRQATVQPDDNAHLPTAANPAASCPVRLLEDRLTGALGWQAEDRCRSLSFRDLLGSVEINGTLRSLKEAAEQTAPGDGETCFRFTDGIIWRRRIRQAGNSLYISAELSNPTGEAVQVGTWNLLDGQSDAGRLADLGDRPQDIRFFAWQAWNLHVLRLADQEAEHQAETVCHLYDPAEGLTVLLAFVTLDRMNTRHRLHYVPGKGICAYKAQCLFGQYRLKAGATLISETLRVTYHDNPYAALESWAEEVHQAYRPSFAGVSGVCLGGGRFAVRSWQENIADRARVARDVLRGFDIRLISGGTHELLKDGLPGNWLVFEPSGGDPDAYEKKLQALQEQGLTFKFWFSPFWFFAEAEGILAENRENLQKNARGEPLTERFDGGGWEFARGQYNQAPLTKYFLDGTHPRTRDYLSRIFRRYREMGVRAYMLDFLSIRPDAKPYREGLLPLESARETLQLIRDSAGPDTHLQTAVASSPGFIGCIQAARVGRDYGETRPLHPFPNWQNAEYCLHDRHFSDAHVFVQNAAASWFTHRKIYINDLNQMRVDKPIPLEHARITATLFGLSGDSPVVLGDNLLEIDAERLRLIKQILPRTSGVPVPADLFERVAPDDYCRVLKKTIVTDWETYTLAAVFNTSPDNHKPVQEAFADRLAFASLGLSAQASYRVFDFWNGHYLGTYRQDFPCLVPPDACRLYRIAPARPHPWLLSTDLHIEQGRAEIETLSWDADNLVLAGAARRPAGESGQLLFLMPRQLKLADQHLLNTMKEVIDMQTVICLPLHFKQDRETFRLQFSRLDTPYVSRRGWLPYATEAEWLDYVAGHPADPARVIE